MGVHVYKTCGNCGCSQSNYSSGYHQSNCPRCGSSNYVSESYQNAANREHRADMDRIESFREAREDREENDRIADSWA